MSKKNRIRKGGRVKQEGLREPNGRLQRNIPDEGTPQIRARKEIITRSSSHEISPLGILAGHGLITEAMHRAADQYRSLHFSAYPDPERPLAPRPFLAKLPSDQWPDDIEHAIGRYRRGSSDEIELKKLYQAMRNALTPDQQEIVHTLAIYGEWPPIMERQAHEIITHRMRWDEDAGLVHGANPSVSLKKAMKAVREALEALSCPKNARNKVVAPLENRV